MKLLTNGTLPTTIEAVIVSLCWVALLGLVYALTTSAFAAEDYYIATGENGTEELYLQDQMVKTNWLNDAVLWMPFPAEKLAGTYYDYSREGNDGAQTTAGFRPSWTNGWGGALVFDGVDDYISVGTGMSGYTSMTVSVWGYFSFAAPAPLVSKWDSTSNLRSYQLTRTTLGIVQWAVSSSGANYHVIKSDDVVAVEGRWYHIVAVYSGGEDTKLYIDGAAQNTSVVADSGTVAGALHINSTDSRVGGTVADGGVEKVMSGNVGGTRIYSRALTAAEVLAEYSAEPTIANGGKR